MRSSLLYKIANLNSGWGLIDFTEVLLLRIKGKLRNECTYYLWDSRWPN